MVGFTLSPRLVRRGEVLAGLFVYWVSSGGLFLDERKVGRIHLAGGQFIGVIGIFFWPFKLTLRGYAF